MPKRGENIRKRKDGRWEGRYIKARDESGRALYGFIYGKHIPRSNKKNYAA